MNTLGDQLREEARIRSEREAKAHRKTVEKQEKEHKEKVDALFAEVLSTLEVRIRNEAGRSPSLSVFDNRMRDLNSVESSVRWRIDAWAKKNGMHTHFNHDPGAWDWPSSDYYVICWKDHTRDRRHHW